MCVVASVIVNTVPIVAHRVSAQAVKPTIPVDNIRTGLDSGKVPEIETTSTNPLVSGTAPDAPGLRAGFSSILKSVAGIGDQERLPEEVQCFTNTDPSKPPIEVITKTPAPFKREGETKYSIKFSDNSSGFSRPSIPNYGGNNEITLPDPAKFSWDNPKACAEIKNTLRATFIGDPWLYPRHRATSSPKQKNNTSEENVVLTENQALAVEHGYKTISDERSGVIEMPTGTGKTIVAMEILDRYIKDSELMNDPNKIVIFLVRNRKILKDLEEKTIPRFYPHLKDCIRKVGAIESSREDFMKGKIFLAGPGALGNNISKILESGKQIAHVIVDEVQDGKADCYDGLIGDLKKWSKDNGWNTTFLGYSATPFRHDNRKVLENFGAGIVHRYTKREAWHEGYLPTMKIQKPKFDMPKDLNEEDTETIKVGDVEIPFWTIRETHKRFPSYNGKTLIIVDNSDQASRLNQYLNKQGLKSVEIHTKNKDEDDDLKRWELPNSETNSAEIAISIDKFNVGVDIRPGHVIICRNIGSNPLLIQILGRGLRPDIQKSHLLVSDLAEFSDNGSFLRIMLSYFREKIQGREYHECLDDLDREDDESKLRMELINHLDELTTHFSRHPKDKDLELECYHLDSSVAARVKEACRDLPSFLGEAHKRFDHIKEVKERQALDRYLADRLDIDTLNDNWQDAYDEKINELAISMAEGSNQQLRGLRETLAPLFTKYSDDGTESYTADDRINFQIRANTIVLDSFKSKILATNKLTGADFTKRMLYIFDELMSKTYKERMRGEANLRSVLRHLFQIKTVEVQTKTVEDILNELLKLKYANSGDKISPSIAELKSNSGKFNALQGQLTEMLSSDPKKVALATDDDLAMIIYMVLHYVEQVRPQHAARIEPKQYAANPDEDANKLHRADFYSTRGIFINKVYGMDLIGTKRVPTEALKQAIKQFEKKGSQDQAELIQQLLNQISEASDLLNQRQLKSLYEVLPKLKKLSEENQKCFSTQIDKLRRIIHEAIIVDTITVNENSYQLKQLDRESDIRRGSTSFCIIEKAKKAGQLFNDRKALWFHVLSGTNVNYYWLEAVNNSDLEQEYRQLSDQEEKQEYLKMAADLIQSAMDFMDASNKDSLILCPKDQEGSSFYRDLQNYLAEHYNKVFGPITMHATLDGSISEMPEVNVDAPSLYRGNSPVVALSRLKETITDYNRQKTTVRLLDDFDKALTAKMKEHSINIYITGMVREVLDTRSNLRGGMVTRKTNTSSYERQDRFNQVLEAMLKKKALLTETDLAALAIILAKITSDAELLSDDSDIAIITNAYINHQLGQAILDAERLKQAKKYIDWFIDTTLVRNNWSALGSTLGFQFSSIQTAMEIKQKQDLSKRKTNESPSKIVLSEDRHLEYMELGSKLAETLKQSSKAAVTVSTSTLPQSVPDLSNLRIHYNDLMGTYMWLTNVAFVEQMRKPKFTTQKQKQPIIAHLNPDCASYKNFEKTEKLTKVQYASYSTFEDLIKKHSAKKVELCHDCCHGFSEKTNPLTFIETLNTYAKSHPGVSNIHIVKEEKSSACV